MFPMTWPQTKQLLSPPRHPPVILLLTAASRKEHNTLKHLPFLFHYLLFSLHPSFSVSLHFCCRVLPMALLIQVKNFSSPSRSLSPVNERIREGKIKRECLRTQRAVYPSQEVWERGRKKHIFRERRRGGQHCTLLPDSWVCVCVCVCATSCVTGRETECQSSQSIQTEKKQTHLDLTLAYNTHIHTHSHTNAHNYLDPL